MAEILKSAKGKIQNQSQDMSEDASIYQKFQMSNSSHFTLTTSENYP